MASGIRDVTVTFAARTAGMVIIIASQSALAWLLGPAGRGSYAVCMVFAMILRVVCSLSCDVACSYFVASRKFTLSEGVVHTVIFAAISSAAAIPIGLYVITLPLSFLAKAPSHSFALALAIVPAAILFEVFSQLLTGVSRFTAYAVFQITVPAAQLGLVLVLSGLLGWGVDGALLSVALAMAANALLILIYFQTRCGMTWVRPSLHALARMLSFGVRYYVSKLSNLANTQIGVVILAFFVSREDIGLFAIASALMAAVEMIPDTLVLVLMPRVAGDSTGRPELVAQSVRVAAAVCGAVLLALAAFAGLIVWILFPADFHPAAALARILCVGMLVRCASKVTVPYLIARDHPGLASFSVAMGVAVNFLALWLLLPALGVTASALAVTLSHLASSAILLISFLRVSGFGWAKLWRYRRADFQSLRTIWRRLWTWRNPVSPSEA